MFSHEGTARSDRQNRVVAGYLALVAGFVNSSGFVFIGSFTSHVTGNVGRLASDAARLDLRAALSALVLVLSFFLGAFVASMILESRFLGHVSRAYASALALEAALLVAFTLAPIGHAGATSRNLDAEGLLLCVAMGAQNSLVTRLSGAVVRTTHLTGVATDLAIEAARWLRYLRLRLSERYRVAIVFGPNPPERPAPTKLFLLGTIATSFFAGAVGGASAATVMGRPAMLVAACAVGACALYALLNGRVHADQPRAR